MRAFTAATIRARVTPPLRTPTSTTSVASKPSLFSSSHRRALPARRSSARPVAFQGTTSSAASSSSQQKPRSSASAVPVRLRVVKRVPFGSSLAVVGVGAPALGEWVDFNVFEWSEGDVWQGEVLAEKGVTLEYKLVVVSGEGKALDWQVGENRKLSVPSGAAVVVEESWEGGEATVEVVEEKEEKKPAPSPAAAAPAAVAAAAPVRSSPAPAAVVREKKPAAPAAAAATTPAPPKPWASAPSSPPAAIATSASASAAASLSSLTVPQLKAKLKAAGLSTTGKKAELISRLKEASSS